MILLLLQLMNDIRRDDHLYAITAVDRMCLFHLAVGAALRKIAVAQTPEPFKRQTRPGYALAQLYHCPVVQALE